MSSIDINVIAERVAEVVNRKLKVFDQRLSEVESKVKKLELDMNVIRGQTIESIIRSVLTFRTEELAATVAVKVSSDFKESLKDVVRVAEDFKSATDAIRDAVKELGGLSNELKALPEKVAEALKSVKPSVDTSGIETMVSGVNIEMSKLVKSVRELTERVGALENTMNGLSTSLAESLVTSITGVISRYFESMEKILEEIKESQDSSRDVLELLRKSVESLLKEGEER